MSKTALSKQEWHDHLSSQEGSPLTQRDYCRERGLSLSAFRYWKRRTAREAETGAASFIEVRRAETVRERRDVYTIEFPNGCSLRVHAAGEVAGIRELSAMVKSL